MMFQNIVLAMPCCIDLSANGLDGSVVALSHGSNVDPNQQEGEHCEQRAVSNDHGADLQEQPTNDHQCPMMDVLPTTFVATLTPLGGGIVDASSSPVLNSRLQHLTASDYATRLDRPPQV